MAGTTDWAGLAVAGGVIVGGYLLYSSGALQRFLAGVQMPTAAVNSPLGYCADGSTPNPTTGLCANGAAPTTIPVANPTAGQQCMGQDALGASCPCPSPTGSPYATGNLLPQQTSYGTGYGSSYNANPYQQQGYGQQYRTYQGSFGYSSSPYSQYSPYGQQSPYGYGQTSPYGTSPYGQTSPYGTSPYGSTQPLGYAQGGGCNCTNCGGTNTITSQGYGQQTSPYGQQSPYGTSPYGTSPYGQQTSPYGIGIGGTPMTPYPYSPYPYAPTGGYPASPYPMLGTSPYPYSPYPVAPIAAVPIGIGGRGGISTRHGYAGKSSVDLNGYAGKAMAIDGYGLR